MIHKARLLRSALILVACLAVACGSGASDETTDPAVVAKDQSLVPEPGDGPTGSSAASTAGTTTTGLPAVTAPSTVTTPPAPTDPVAEARALGCSGLGRAPERAQLTFTVGTALYGLGDNGAIMCLQELDRATSDHRWGPHGDRLITSDGTLLRADGTAATLGTLRSPEWTRPTGESVIYVNGDGSLSKAGADGGPAQQLSPLDAHSAVAYHPDGLTFAVAGSADDEDGIWISKNDGTNPQLLTFGDGVRVPELAFDDAGEWLYFVADHGGESHVHSVWLEPIEVDEGTLALSTSFEDGFADLATGDAIADLAPHPSESGLVAYAAGTCGERIATLVRWDDTTQETVATALSNGPSRPVGFLSDASAPATVVIALSDDGCNGPWTLDLVTVDDAGTVVDRSQPVPVEIDSAAVRAVAGQARFSLAGVIIEPFA